MDSPKITIMSVSSRKDIEKLIAESTPWIYAAGNPYYDWFFGSSQATSKTLISWIRRSSSEISIQKVRFLMCGDLFLGGYIALSGQQLKLCRKADTLALMKVIKTEKRSDLMQRLSIASSLFHSVDDDEYYLSKMGLNPKFRGKGFANVLVEKYIEEGKLQKFKRFRLDVFSENVAAIHCYEKHGFKIDSKSESKDGSMTYYSMINNLN